MCHWGVASTALTRFADLAAYFRCKPLKMFNAILMSILFTACATTHQVYLPAPGYGMDGVYEGDTVKIVMNDGKKYSFLVTRVDEIGLHGSHNSFVYSDMQTVVVIEKRQAPGKLTWAILGITVIAVAVLGAGDYSSGYGPFCLYSSNDPKRRCL